jgi:hypothetical protein
MKRKLLRLVPLVILLGAWGWSAAAYAFTYMSASGNSCQPHTADHPIKHGLEGAVNPSASSETVFFCPLFTANQTAARTLEAMVLKFKDGSNSVPFSCRAFQTYPWGSTYETDPKYTCSTAGGCTDSTTSFTGFNYIQWTYSELGSNIGIENLDTNFGFYCSLPRGNSSWIIGYYSYY